MEYILDSVRRIISRWVSTQTRLTENAEPGDTVLTVSTSNRFREHDETIIRNAVQGETPIIVDSIIDETHIQLEDAVRFRWEVSDNAILEKTFNQNMVQGIYLGDPDVIPRYPAVTVTALNRTSKWLTIDSTHETYNVQIAIYVRDANQEGAYRFLLQMVDTIQRGLKQNIYPLVGPYNTTTLLADIAEQDTFIKVNDISLFEKGSRINIEDRWKVGEYMVQSVVDDETLQLSQPTCYSWNMSDNTQVIKLDRFFFNSWPATIDYGKIFKGTMLKAATIDWFAWEESIENTFPRETSIL